MKVAFLTHEYPPYIFGGIGSFAKNLADSLSKLGVEVTIISGIPAYNLRKATTRKVEGDITVLRFPYPNIPPRHTFFQIANMKSLCKAIRSEHPDVVHGQSWSSYPTLLNLKQDIPSIVTFHASPKMEKVTSIRSILRGGSLTDIFTYVLGYYPMSFLSNHELKLSNLSVAVSKTLRSELINEFGQKYSGKIKTIYNGVNLEKFDAEYELAGNGAEESENTIFFAGRLFWRKGALNLIRMAYLLQKQNSTFKIIVHGIGPLFHKLQSEISFLGLRNIELKGFTTRQQLMENMHKSKFIVVPSMYEACPMSLLEGMCSGKIPIMLKKPFSNELSENGAYGVLEDNMDSLTNKLLEFRDTEDLQSFGNRIRTFAREKYDSKKVAREYLQVYKKICS